MRKQHTEEFQFSAVCNNEACTQAGYFFFFLHGLESARNDYIDLFSKFRMYFSYCRGSFQTWQSTFCRHQDKWHVTMAFWMPSYLLSFLALCVAKMQS